MVWNCNNIQQQHSTTATSDNTNKNDKNNNINMTTNNAATATNRSPKRVRINDQPEIVGTSDSPGILKTKPIDAVKNHLLISARSHTSSMQTLLMDRGLEFTLIQTKIEQKNEIKRKFADATFIPRSTRFDFTLTSTASVQETTEFKTLTDKCATAIQTAQTELISAMKSVIDLELTSLKNERMTLFCKTLKQVSELVLVMNEHDAKHHIKIARLALTTHHATILKHFTETSRETSLKAFNEYALTTESDETPDAEPNNIERVLFDSMLPTIQSIMKLVFAESWDKLTEAKQKSDLDTKLAATIRKFDILKATDDTAMEIDSEPAVEPKTLKNIVESEVATTNKLLEKRLQKLEQTIRRSSNQPKNSTRGANNSNTNSAARSKKKT